jgi:antitoxin MazE
MEEAMRARVQKWGNSLAVRIPRAFAEQSGLKENTPIDLSLTEGRLLIEPIPEPDLTLEELLAGVTDQNLHGEIDTGPSAGNEAW